MLLLGSACYTRAQFVADWFCCFWNLLGSCAMTLLASNLHLFQLVQSLCLTLSQHHNTSTQQCLLISLSCIMIILLNSCQAAPVICFLWQSLIPTFCFGWNFKSKVLCCELARQAAWQDGSTCVSLSLCPAYVTCMLYPASLKNILVNIS